VHQNAAEEINRAYIDRNGIPVVRRLSGGGAVFHDLGNINYSFITAVPDAGKLDVRSFCKPVVEALEELGVHAESGGRNDLTINGRKFSGNARYLRMGRLMHHGTILFDTDLEKMSEVLNAPEDEIISKSVKSLRAQVTNLRDYLSTDMTAAKFWTFLRNSIVVNWHMSPYTMTGQDWNAIEEIRGQRYAAWDWNYGQSPDYSIKKGRHFRGLGDIRISMQVKNGKISDFAIDGGLLENKFGVDFTAALLNTRMEKDALTEALSKIPPEKFCKGISGEDFARLIVE
jgi:lipoate-protein ligase A